MSALAGTDPAAVRQIVARLSALLRRVLDSDAADEVPLREELAFLRDYLDVQRVRFEGGLAVEEDIDADTLDALVPNLILQPLVENAIEHGVGKVREGGGRITLRARREQGPGGTDRLVVGISDNGPGLPTKVPGEPPSRPNGIGIANTRARLEAHYGAAGTLTLKRAAGGGLTAEVALPYRRAADPTEETRTDEMLLLRETIQALEQQLDPAQFFRIHRSTIIRLDLVEEVLIGTAGDYAVRLKDGTRLRVARGRRDELEKRLHALR